MNGYTKVKKLNELKGHKQVYVITAMHPETVSTINLVGVDQTARQHVGDQLKKWIRNKELYIKDEIKTTKQQSVQPHSNRKGSGKGGHNANLW